MNEERLLGDHIGDGCPACRASRESGEETTRISRRSLLRLGATAGAAAAVTPHLLSLEAAAADLREARAPRAAAASNPGFPVPPIVTRAQWGADESIREPGQTYDTGVEKLIVHHTVTPNNPADPASVVRNVYRYHVSGEYIDIAYNWLIDHRGRIYEGRWAQDYGHAPHIGEKGGLQVRGGHTYRHNARSIGIALLGTFTSQAPPAPMIDSLVTLLAWKCSRWGIDPYGASPYTMSDGAVHAVPNILGHRNAKATECPGDPVLSLLPSIRGRVAARMRRGNGGYWIASANGSLLTYGNIPDLGDLPRLDVSARVIGFAGHPSNNGYWMLGSDGGVFSFGEAEYRGSMGGKRLAQPVVAIASTPAGDGYWIAARDGGVFNFGDAQFFGSAGSIRLREPIVGMAATPSGKGYWLVARDGGVFNFGDARFLGSAYGHTGSSVVAIGSSDTGGGYAVLNRDGEVFAFGDAPYLGGADGRLSDVVGFAGKLTRS